MAPLPIILDCDPGHDDALAILMALARPEIELLGITTVAGNAELTETTQERPGDPGIGRTHRHPRRRWCCGPARRELVTAAYVHGSSGLEGADLPTPTAGAEPAGAQALLVRLIESADQPVTLVPTGPLTNIARLCIDRPDLLTRIDRVCLMGGAVGEGNRTASAEFNIWVDPDAAKLVFESDLALTMVTIDVTHQAVVPLAHTMAGPISAIAPGASSRICFATSRASTSNATAGTARPSTMPWPWRCWYRPRSSRRADTASTSRRRAN